MAFGKTIHSPGPMPFSVNQVGFCLEGSGLDLPILPSPDGALSFDDIWIHVSSHPLKIYPVYCTPDRDRCTLYFRQVETRSEDDRGVWGPTASVGRISSAGQSATHFKTTRTIAMLFRNPVPVNRKNRYFSFFVDSEGDSVYSTVCASALRRAARPTSFRA